MEGDVIHNLRDNIKHIVHFHTAGNPGRHEIDDSQQRSALRGSLAGHFRWWDRSRRI